MNRSNVRNRLLTAVALVSLGLACTERSIESSRPGELPMVDLDKSPEVNSATYFAHGHLLERQGNFEQAMLQYRRALAVTPTMVAARNRLGITFNKLNRNAEASAEFREAVALAPDKSYLHNNLGFSLYLEGKFEEAETAIRRALEITPEFPRARMNLGVVLAKQGRFDDAFAAFKDACPLPEAYYNLAMVQTEAQHYREAAEALDTALRINPKFEPAKAQLREIARLAEEQEAMIAAAEAAAAAEAEALAAAAADQAPEADAAPLTAQADQQTDSADSTAAPSSDADTTPLAIAQADQASAVDDDFVGPIYIDSDLPFSPLSPVVAGIVVEAQVQEQRLNQSATNANYAALRFGCLENPQAVIALAQLWPSDASATNVPPDYVALDLLAQLYSPHTTGLPTAPCDGSPLDWALLAWQVNQSFDQYSFWLQYPQLWTDPEVQLAWRIAQLTGLMP